MRTRISTPTYLSTRTFRRIKNTLLQTTYPKADKMHTYKAEIKSEPRYLLFRRTCGMPPGRHQTRAFLGQGCHEQIRPVGGDI